VSEAREEFGNPEEKEPPPLEAFTRGVGKTQLIYKTNCLLYCTLAISLEIIVVTTCKETNKSNYQSKPGLNYFHYVTIQ
jgi:hypothetical protein